MKLKIQKVDIVILIIIVIVVGFIFINEHRIARNECIKECVYGEDVAFRTEENNGLKSLVSGSGEMVWKFDNRIFETKDECFDYCMIVK